MGWWVLPTLGCILGLLRQYSIILGAKEEDELEKGVIHGDRLLLGCLNIVEWHRQKMQKQSWKLREKGVT